MQVIFVVFVCALITTLEELPELGLPDWLFVVIFQVRHRVLGDCVAHVIDCCPHVCRVVFLELSL